MNTYVVEGGIGKCTAFTALINKLTEKDKSPVQIYTPYIDCFAGNPNVKLVLEQSLPIQDPRIMASDNIHYSEPYKSNFQFGKQHIIESYCNLHGVEFDINMKPKLYTSQHKEEVNKWKEQNNIDKYILIQFSGGQSPIAYTGQYHNHNPNRNYPPFLAQQIVNLLKVEYPNFTLIDCTLPNEPAFINTIKCNLHWSRVHELLKDAEGFISIDSCMNHFSASANKHGVVLWGSTRWIQFGYSHNTNLQFHMDSEWNEDKYIDSDPRNIMIDPYKVVEEFKKIDKSKPVACATN